MGILEIIIVAILIIWFGGFLLNVAGLFIHILLPVAAILIIYKVFFQKKTVVRHK